VPGSIAGPGFHESVAVEGQCAPREERPSNSALWIAYPKTQRGASAAVSMPMLVNLLRRRWWLIVAVVAVALAVAGTYASRQRHVYESTATLYIRLSRTFATQAGPGAVSSQLGVLTYGSLANTFVAIAQSRSTLRDAASALGIPSDQLGSFTAVVTQRPQSFVLDMSVDGPDRSRVVGLANELSHRVASEVASAYPTVALSSLDAASTSSQVRPRFARDLVYGGLAGLILGFVFAALSLFKTTAHLEIRSRKRQGSGSDELESEADEEPEDAQLPAAPAG